MNRGKYLISDEHLNAFVDGQLDSREQNHLFKLINEDESLAQRICELRNSNEMIQFAYHNPPRPNRNRNIKSHDISYISGFAAALLVTIGFISGKLYYSESTANAPRLSDNIHYNTSQLPTLNQDVILHLDSSSPEKFIETLASAEAILNYYQDKQLNHSVEIIVNNDGLNLLRVNNSPHSGQIQSLMDKFQNISFIACSRAISRFKSRGIDIELLPNTDIAPSGLDKIIKRLDQGWAYIKV